MDVTEYEARIAALEKENRILKQKLVRSEANRAMMEEALATHARALKARNAELEKSRDLIRQSEARCRLMAFHDPLTGLPNRFMFQERLAQAITQAQKLQTLVAVLFIYLNRFKPVNDTWGHEVGDSVLQTVANRRRDCVRGKDTVARIGGDEFAILIANLQELEDAGKLAQRILRKITKPIPFETHFCSIGASIGISHYPSDGDDVNLLIQSADAAMYSIKKSGRNGYRYYQDLEQKKLAPL
jgi:diguanylate cyclase (GGDEF)-like protein